MSEVVVAPEVESAVPAAPLMESDAANSPAAVLADCTRAEQVESRYMAALQTLVDDALEQRHVEILVEVLTWNLARIGYGYGVQSVGDIVRRLGGHLGDIAQREAAVREAAEAKKAGRMTQ
jgi:hypothetical protein